MPRVSSDYVPRYRQHKQSGSGIVTLNYKDHLLGRYGTPESLARYHELIARWIKGGRQPLDPLPAGETAVALPLTVNALLDRFLAFAAIHYRRADGSTTTEVLNCTYAFRPLRDLFGATPAAEFAPLRLKLVRDRMVEAGRVRTAINRDIKRIRYAFRWAVGEELIPSSVSESLRAVDSLKRGRSAAAESDPIRPVSIDVVEATKRFCPQPVADLIDLQLLTGARPGEVLVMRPMDIDTSGNVWKYRPATHKTAHHDHDRVIHLGKDAQTILVRAMAGRESDQPIFSPRDGNAAAKAARSTKGKRRRAGQKANSTRTARKIGNAYRLDSYRRAINRAASLADAAAHAAREKAGQPPVNGRIIPHWHPHRLRHSAGTLVRKRYGLEASKLFLGHSSVTATQVYAERDMEQAEKIASEIG